MHLPKLGKMEGIPPVLGKERIPSAIPNVERRRGPELGKERILPEGKKERIPPELGKKERIPPEGKKERIPPELGKKERIPPAIPDMERR
jgi:hypothetical protein